MAFDTEGPQKALDEMFGQIDAAEKELAALKQQHPRHATEHAENAARAKMKGRPCEKPPALVTMEARMQELEEFLPNAKEVLRKDQWQFAQAAAAYLETKRAKLAPEAEAKLQIAYGKVAVAIEELAGIVGAYEARGILLPGDHSRWIMERLEKIKLQELGLRQQVTILESTIKSILGTKGRGRCLASHAAYFQD